MLGIVENLNSEITTIKEEMKTLFVMFHHYKANLEHQQRSNPPVGTISTKSKKIAGSPSEKDISAKFDKAGIILAC